MKKKILIVDDEENTMEMLKLRLTDAGYEAILVNDGWKAYDLITKEKFDLVLTDSRMPGLDGFSICGMIKDDARLKDIPVIVYSALRYGELSKIANKHGANAFLQKPFDGEELLGLIGKMLNAKKRES